MMLVFSLFVALYLFFESRHALSRKHTAIVSLMPVGLMLAAVLIDRFAFGAFIAIGPLRVSILQAAALVCGAVIPRKVLVPRFVVEE